MYVRHIPVGFTSIRPDQLGLSFCAGVVSRKGRIPAHVACRPSTGRRSMVTPGPPTTCRCGAYHPLRGTKLLTGPIRTYEVHRPVRVALAKLGL